MKKINCAHLTCKNKIHIMYSDIWKCKCKNYYCNEHRFNHNCVIIEKKPLVKIEQLKVEKI
jgi:hypothetical protein